MAKVNNGNFQISQEYEVIPPEKSKAYPILVHEWDFIKEKIKKINISFLFFDSFGFLLIGAALTCLITILTTDIPKKENENLMWVICIFLAIIGILSLYFSYSKRNEETAKPTEIIEQMELIENRFKNGTN